MNAEAKIDTRRSFIAALAVFVLLVLLAGAAERALFNRYERQAIAETTSDLASRGRLRVAQLSAFLKERRGDAQVAAGLLASTVSPAWWQDGGDKDKAAPRRVLDPILRRYGYAGALILDTGGDVRFSTGRSVGLSAQGKAHALRALGQASGGLLEIYAAEPDGAQAFTLDIFAPVMSADGVRAAGILILRTDWDELFAMTQPWPEDSRTAEYLLARKDGEEVQILNRLRHQQPDRQKLRIPLSADENANAWPVIRAVQGHYGALQSRDYRGKEVLAYTLPVPETGWSMVIKEDTDDALAELRRIGTVATLAFLAAAALVFALWWWWLRTRARAAQALLESRERFEKVFRASPDSIALSRLETGEFVEVNEGFERISGYTRAEAIGHSAIALGLWTQPGQREALMAQLASGASVRDLETVLRRKDGAERSVQISLEIIRVADTRYLLTIGRDVTDARLVQQALQRERDFAAGLIEAAPVIMLTLDLQGRIQHVNRRFEELTGRRLDEVRGKDWFDAFLPERDRRRVRALFELAAKGVPTRGNVNSVVTRSGEQLQIEWYDQVVRNERGEVSAVLATGQDITARRRHEEALRASTERLNEAQRIAKVGNWELDLASGKLSWSDEIFRIFEIDQARFDATYEAFLNAIHPEDREGVNAAYTDSLETRTPYDISHRLLMADGRVKYVREHCESEFDAAGKPLRSVGTVQDISDLRQAEELIRQLNAGLEQRVRQRTAELETANKELETFTYSVSHDLKSPLRGIDGYSRLLLANHTDRLDEEGRQYLRNVRRAAQQMSQLIEDLLAYSRLERRGMQADRIDPAVVIDALLAENMGEIGQRGIAVSVDVACASVTADRDGLVLALRNLIENALKFTRDAAQPAIEIRARDSGAMCILSVRDNGLGFDMKYHDRIFDIFQRLHRSEDYPGTGIGLAIVKKAMQRMGGRAWAESESGKGAVFYLEIPE